MSIDLFSTELIGSYTDHPRFVARPWLETRVLDAVGEDGNGVVLITGEPGAGKTALLAHIAAQHPSALRHFVRHDSMFPLHGGDARTLLFALGHQLALLSPESFDPQSLEIAVRVRADEIGRGAQAIGLQVEDLQISPFYRTSVDVTVTAGVVHGDLIGISAGRMTLEPRLLQLSNLQHLALFDPAAVLLERDPGARTLILIDAVDEIRYEPDGEDILAWLAGCGELPSNLRFVLTSRPDHDLLEPLRAMRGSTLTEIEIDPSAPDERLDIQADIRRFLDGFAGEPPVRDAFHRHRLQSSRFVKEATEKAEGNFQYVNALARGIDAALTADPASEDVRSLLCLEAVPSETAALYRFFLGRLKARARRTVALDGPGTAEPERATAWEVAHRPILCVLAVAFEPLSEKQLRAYAEVPTEAFPGAVEDLAQFLKRTPEGRWRLYHDTFAEFLTGIATGAADPFHVDARRWHSRLAGHLLGAGPDWGEAPDPYAVSYLPEHLLAGFQYSELWELARSQSFRDAQVRLFGTASMRSQGVLDAAVAAAQHATEPVRLAEFALRRILAWNRHDPSRFYGDTDPAGDLEGFDRARLGPLRVLLYAWKLLDEDALSRATEILESLDSWALSESGNWGAAAALLIGETAVLSRGTTERLSRAMLDDVDRPNLVVHLIDGEQWELARDIALQIGNRDVRMDALRWLAEEMAMRNADADALCVWRDIVESSTAAEASYSAKNWVAAITRVNDPDTATQLLPDDWLSKPWVQAAIGAVLLRYGRRRDGKRQFKHAFSSPASFSDWLEIAYYAAVAGLRESAHDALERARAASRGAPQKWHLVRAMCQLGLVKQAADLADDVVALARAVWPEIAEYGETLDRLEAASGAEGVWALLAVADAARPRQPVLAEQAVRRALTEASELPGEGALAIECARAARRIVSHDKRLATRAYARRRLNDALRGDTTFQARVLSSAWLATAIRVSVAARHGGSEDAAGELLKDALARAAREPDRLPYISSLLPALQLLAGEGQLDAVRSCLKICGTEPPRRRDVLPLVESLSAAGAADLAREIWDGASPDGLWRSLLDLPLTTALKMSVTDYPIEIEAGQARACLRDRGLTSALRMCDEHPMPVGRLRMLAALKRESDDPEVKATITRAASDTCQTVEAHARDADWGAGELTPIYVLAELASPGAFDLCRSVVERRRTQWMSHNFMLRGYNPWDRSTKELRSAEWFGEITRPAALMVRALTCGGFQETARELLDAAKQDLQFIDDIDLYAQGAAALAVSAVHLREPKEALRLIRLALPYVPRAAVEVAAALGELMPENAALSISSLQALATDMSSMIGMCGVAALAHPQRALEIHALLETLASDSHPTRHEVRQ